MRGLARPTYYLRHLWPLMNFYGLKVKMKGDHVSLAVWKRAFRGDYEAPEIKALLALVRPTDRILELGAGMGLVSGIAAKRFPGISVQSYEANPVLIPVIEELHRNNGLSNVALHNQILMPVDQGGTRTFHLAPSFAESSMLDGGCGGKSIEVPLRDIRTVLADFRPDILLCDIEGGEAELFPGLDMQGLRAVIVELHPTVIGRQSEAAIYDAFAASGLYPRVELCSGTVVAFEKVDLNTVTESPG